jgi:hypothetical protein
LCEGWCSAMPIFQTFSKRKKALEKAGQDDVYQYSTLPQRFRVQATQILAATLGDALEGDNFNGYRKLPSFGIWEAIFKIQTHELGVYTLSKSSPSHTDPQRQCLDAILQADTDQALDVIELALHAAVKFKKALEQRMGITSYRIPQEVDDAVEEMNSRFKEHSLGYQYTNGQIIRVDSELIHQEVVRPALRLLGELQFRGASEEFEKAFEHFRHQNHKEAITEAAKAFESTLKSICDARQWKYKPTATAKDLLDVVFEKELIPSELLSQFSALRSVLESGLPTVRNKNSSHGQGSMPIEAPEHLVAFALHLAASNIVFLVQAHKAKK